MALSLFDAGTARIQLEYWNGGMMVVDAEAAEFFFQHSSIPSFHRS
ncbi:MAG: hypothetical protein PHE10_06555 [Kiritimatiellae bacterium]|nr:hypothetical protein [Kiritimatiellia bacterium]